MYSNHNLLNKAIELYSEIKYKYGFEYSNILKTVMIDIYGKFGKFQQAINLIGNETDFIMWNTLLGACRKFNNIEMGEIIFNKILTINDKQPFPYLMMMNIYSNHNLKEKVENIRNLMESKGIKKIPSKVSYYDENGNILEFISGSILPQNNISKIESQQIFHKLNEIHEQVIKEGYSPDLNVLSNFNLQNEALKIESLKMHAEKIALSHALINSSSQSKIFLKSNIRMCNDCHDFMLKASKILTNMEIIIKDSSRIHIFKQGQCSCQNYW